jgi:hypothetical protein
MEPELKELCDELRKEIKEISLRVISLKKHHDFRAEQTYEGQHGEMKANIMLSYRHLEDARMRIGKILQASDDGVSVYDK